MYIHRALLLLIGILIVFWPSVEQWLNSPEIAWHRPYQLWLLLVLTIYWSQRSSPPDEL